jgi:hypothetical protein
MSAAAPLPLRRKVSLIAEIVDAYVRVRWQLRRREFPQVLELSRALEPVRSGDPVGDDRLARGVRRTLSLLPGDSRCLTQSLVLTRLLARRGRLSRLVIGVSPGQAFGAHAWVERDDVPLLPSHGREFERLAEL